MGEDQTNTQLERQNTSPMQAMIRVFLENPFFSIEKQAKMETKSNSRCAVPSPANS